MNWEQVEGQWKQVASQIKSKWAKFTDDDVMNLAAKRDDIVGKVQERYGIMKEAAEAQVDDWIRELKPGRDAAPPKRPNADAAGRSSVR